MTVLNNYIFLDANNIVIDILAFDDESSDDVLINNIKNLINAEYVIRNDNDFTPLNSVQTVKYFGSAIPGYSWDGVDTFLPPKPEGNYILNYDRTSWVEVPIVIDETGGM